MTTLHLYALDSSTLARPWQAIVATLDELQAQLVARHSGAAWFAVGVSVGIDSDAWPLVGIGSLDAIAPRAAEAPVGTTYHLIKDPRDQPVRSAYRMHLAESWARAERDDDRLEQLRWKRVQALTRGSLADLTATFPNPGSPTALAASLHALAALTRGSAWERRHCAPHPHLAAIIIDGPAKVEAVESYLQGAVARFATALDEDGLLALNGLVGVARSLRISAPKGRPDPAWSAEMDATMITTPHEFPNCVGERSWVLPSVACPKGFVHVSWPTWRGDTPDEREASRWLSLLESRARIFADDLLDPTAGAVLRRDLARAGVYGGEAHDLPFAIEPALPRLIAAFPTLARIYSHPEQFTPPKSDA